MSCRYKVFQKPELPYYTFTTDKTIEYAVIFEDDNTLFDDTSVEGTIQSVSSISIEKITTQVSGHDPEIKKTIIAILELFFQNPYNILTFYCDSSDSRESKRKNHFHRWFSEYANSRNYIKLDNTIDTGYNLIHSSVLFRRDNPLHASILAGHSELDSYYKNKP